MLRITKMPDVTKLEEMVNESCGNVYLVLSDDDKIGLKGNEDIWKFMKATKPEGSLDLSFEDPRDVRPFIALMMNAKYAV